MANGTSSHKSSGVSKGALAGAVIGVLLFLSLAIGLFLWYRRTARIRAQRAATESEGKKDIPAPAETVLNRPDPTEKPSPPPSQTNTVRVYSISSDTTIDLDPASQHGSAHTARHTSSRASTQTNPFDDTNSIQTAGTEGTNVIPIALVHPDSTISIRSQSETMPSVTSDAMSPVRPARSPDLNLLDQNVSDRSLNTKPGLYAPSQRSGVSAVSSRNSYMSNASYSSDFLNEAPMIMTPTKGAVRQVLGVVKAEVINARGSNENLSPSSTKVPRLPASSPLASTSFGPADVVKEVDEGQELSLNNNPFSDEHSADGHSFSRVSPSPSAATFGHSTDSEWAVEPKLPWSKSSEPSRPSSISTQAGSIIDIGSAKRVNVGLNGLNGGNQAATSPMTASTFTLSPYRTTIGRLVTPSTSGLGSLEEQQQRALAHAQARAQAQGLDKSRRISNSSVVSSASTRADSILESFPFVPPSPISDRPIRSPPCSPLAQQTFNSGPPSPQKHAASPLARESFTPELTQRGDSASGSEHARESESPLPPPPDRRTLGLSTGSQFSTASSGLGSFPFQIEGENIEASAPPPTSFKGRQRASLDTLALTSDLSSYPLGI